MKVKDLIEEESYSGGDTLEDENNLLKTGSASFATWLSLVS